MQPDLTLAKLSLMDQLTTQSDMLAFSLIWDSSDPQPSLSGLCFANRVLTRALKVIPCKVAEMLYHRMSAT
jgi:hypothetical protein